MDARLHERGRLSLFVRSVVPDIWKTEGAGALNVSGAVAVAGAGGKQVSGRTRTHTVTSGT